MHLQSSRPVRCGRGPHDICVCWCHVSVLPNPLDEKDAEIERLQRLIEVKDEALQSVRTWLQPAIYQDEKDLDDLVHQALESK